MNKDQNLHNVVNRAKHQVERKPSGQHAYARGGAGSNHHVFGQQQAGSRKSSDKSPSTGKPDSRGPGQKFAKGGGEDRIFGGYAMPARPSMTVSNRPPERSRTRDYGK